MYVAIVLGSAVSLIGGSLLFLPKKRRNYAILLAMPFGAGALLAAAFFDLLPEAFELGDPRTLLMWTTVGFTAFFLLERLASWFHHHHEHDHQHRKEAQGGMVMIGDLMHNMIDGVAIGAAFVANPATGIITTIAVSAHEVPKELGTFGILLSRGWRDKKVILANIATAVGTLIAASVVYWLGANHTMPVGELLAITSGMFIYIAASDIIPDIHEQPRKIGTAQAIVLVIGIALVAVIIRALGV
jgi:zinc and cadmium transporter